MKIDLHIGMHKTGTSSIQKFLSELSERDAYAPFVYPEAHKGNHSYLIGGGFGRLENADHHRMMKFGGTVPLKSARRSAARALIESGMIQADNKSVPLIISAEDASVLHRSEVEDLISFLDKKGASDIHVSFYALMSVFDFPGTIRLPRWREMVKICSLYRRWRRQAEPMVVILSSADWIPPDQIRYG